VQQDGEEGVNAQLITLQECGADEDAIEEGVRQQSDERVDADAVRDGVSLLAEMEVRCERMLRQMDGEVSDEHDEERARSVAGDGFTRDFGEQSNEDDGEHEAGAEAGKHGECCTVASRAPQHERAAGDIAE
jgi:hypothetical protein